MPESLLRLSASDPQAVRLTRFIQQGEIEALRQTLEDQPALARAIVVDAKGIGRTLLHLATDWPGHFPQVAGTIGVLIAAGADVNAGMRNSAAPDAPGETPLHWAASSDDVAAIDALLDGGADLEARGAVFTGGTPMSDAVIFAQWNAARRLLERGAGTTLSQSAALGLLDRVREFFSRSQPAPSEVTASLWHACRGGNLPTVSFLLERGADINWIGWDHLTPLDAAQKSGNGELVAWLRTLGARTGRQLHG